MNLHVPSFPCCCESGCGRGQWWLWSAHTHSGDKRTPARSNVNSQHVWLQCEGGVFSLGALTNAAPAFVHMCVTLNGAARGSKRSGSPDLATAWSGYIPCHMNTVLGGFVRAKYINDVPGRSLACMGHQKKLHRRCYLPYRLTVHRQHGTALPWRAQTVLSVPECFLTTLLPCT